jgi:hypothetical protein|tara:strand:- start:1817 stop:2314 length:498 start_codon:yes stop_codon:yes gene_type:complete
MALKKDSNPVLINENHEERLIFNLAMSSLERINKILMMIHDSSYYALQGDVQSFFSWRTWLSRLYRETKSLFTPQERKDAEDLLKIVNQLLQKINTQMKLPDYYKNRNSVKTSELAMALEVAEDYLRDLIQQRELLFPKRQSEWDKAMEEEGWMEEQEDSDEVVT